MTKHLSVILVVGLAATDVGCGAHDFEKHFFFSEPPATRVERSRKLSLEQQYLVFRYGNDVIHPPLMDLAEPIADRGKEAVPFLFEAASAGWPRHIRDIVWVFTLMALSRTYDVKSDPALLDELISRVNNMKDTDWRAMCESNLKRIQDAK
jgi:hypothetical protein